MPNKLLSCQSPHEICLLSRSFVSTRWLLLLLQPLQQRRRRQSHSTRINKFMPSQFNNNYCNKSFQVAKHLNAITSDDCQYSNLNTKSNKSLINSGDKIAQNNLHNHSAKALSAWSLSSGSSSSSSSLTPPSSSSSSSQNNKRLSCNELESLKERFVDFIQLDHSVFGVSSQLSSTDPEAAAV